jgi:hypothetical protein
LSLIYTLLPIHSGNQALFYLKLGDGEVVFPRSEKIVSTVSQSSVTLDIVFPQMGGGDNESTFCTGTYCFLIVI